jgi:hypothetical protein
MATAEATREFTNDTKDLGDKIVSLTLKAAKELSDYLDEVHGIKPAAGGAVMMAGPGGAGGGPGGAAEAAVEKSEFDVILVGEGGHDDGNPTGGGDPVEVARGHEGERGMLLAGCTVVGVDADEGLGCHGVSPEDRRIVDPLLRPNTGWSYVDPRIPRMNLPPSAAPRSTDLFDVRNDPSGPLHHTLVQRHP